MADGSTVFWIRVAVGGDPHRGGRLVRSLRDELRDALGVQVSLATEQDAPGPLLWASLGSSGAVTAPALLCAISEWCARDASHEVELVLGGRSMWLSGRPNECPELVRALPRDLRADA
ncbi:MULTISPECIES: hypothetical protein [unclassified Saccharopolyspora]|uniref:hypothetical protein n=1 Tax=unclassified Saccharopolyspora TaxID=2646250 RepID=UPI001CD76B5E|nr:MULTISPECIES: hypothetical protein [unclassified Saccharopolyspora]MCA1189620.1 hypothetical protein [Saccharopolyspora sp. 6T]MCA1280540.1 hypothetical protein [Saccharopolyspora sp. 7B]